MNENQTTEGTQQAPHEGPHEGPRVSAEQMRDLGNLRRSTYDRHVAGVAGGLGRHFDVDPVIIRVAFVVLTFFGGAGLIIYLACWLLVPEDTGQHATINLDARSRNIALIGVGILAGLALVGDAWGPGWFPWPLFAVGLIAWVFLSRKQRRSDAGQQSGSWAPYATPGQAPGQAPGWVTSPASGGAARPEGPATATYTESTAPTSASYAAPGASPSYAGPTAPMAPAPPRPPRNPRKRGPILFWFTLALTALACGVLGIIDLAGAPVADSAYPALALGVIAVMLLVGAFYGRAGGLIFLGLVAAVVLSGSTIASRWDGTTINETPTSASQLRSSYDIDAGQVKLDLTQIRDLEALDGRTLDLRVEAGQIEVVVPRELHVSVDGDVEVGQLTFFGQGSGGFDISLDNVHSGDSPRPHLHIDTDVEIGEAKVMAR